MLMTTKMINSRVPQLIATVNNNSRVTESVKMTFNHLLQREIMESHLEKSC